MNKIEVKDMGYRTCLTFWTGSEKGAMTATIFYLDHYTRQQLIKDLRNPTPYQPNQQHGQDH